MTNKTEIARLKLIADALYQRDQAKLLKINSQIRDSETCEQALKDRKRDVGHLNVESDPMALAKWLSWTEDSVAKSKTDQANLSEERDGLASNAAKSLGRVSAIEELDVNLRIEERRKRDRQ